MASSTAYGGAFAPVRFVIFQELECVFLLRDATVVRVSRISLLLTSNHGPDVIRILLSALVSSCPADLCI